MPYLVSDDESGDESDDESRDELDGDESSPDCLVGAILEKKGNSPLSMPGHCAYW